VVIDPPGESYQISGALERVAPGGEVRPSRRYCENNGIKGAWRLTTRVPRQAV